MYGKRTISTAAATAAVIAALAGLAGAQSKEPRTGWGSIMSQSNSAAVRADANDPCATPIRGGNNIYSALVGSWFNTVTISSGAAFTDLQTFNVGGDNGPQRFTWKRRIVRSWCLGW